MAKHSSNINLSDYAMDLLSKLPPESNIKTKAYIKLGIKTDNALDSQAQIQLFDALCSKKECLNCNVAEFLLKNSV